MMKPSLFLFAASALQLGVGAVSPSGLTTSNLEYFSQYAAAAYCKQKVGAPVTCGANACPRVESAHATILSVYEELPPFQTTGFVALDHTIKSIVFTFRGAEGLGFLTALSEKLSPCDSVCPGCQCNNGFYTSWLSARNVVMKDVLEARRKHSKYSLVVAGHSLGAIQATYAAAEYRQNGSAVDLYSYGSPREGDAKAVDHISRQHGNFRVTHTDDPAPKMGSVADGLRHVSPEYWIARDAAGFRVKPVDIKVIPGNNNNTGNAGTGGFDVLAHVQYFQVNIGACFLPILGK